MLNGSPEFIPIDEQSNDQVVHTLCLRKADRPVHQPFDPCAQIDPTFRNALFILPTLSTLASRNLDGVTDMDLDVSMSFSYSLL
jgi:hypothetical protein